MREALANDETGHILFWNAPSFLDSYYSNLCEPTLFFCSVLQLPCRPAPRHDGIIARLFLDRSKVSPPQFDASSIR